MAYASLQGRARPKAGAAAVCDRCGGVWNFSSLRAQFEWRGPSLMDIRILVCPPCYDVPQENLRSIVVPADPTPIINARPQDFLAASTDYRTLSAPTVFDAVTGIPVPSTDLRTTQNCENRTLVPYAKQAKLDANAIMPQFQSQFFDVVLPVLSVYSIGCTVTVTCSAPHGLQTGAQVSVEGFTNGNGFFSVIVLTATAFTYTTIGPVSVQMTPNVRVATASVRLPRGYDVFPMTTSDAAARSVVTVPGPPTNVIAVVSSGSGSDNYNFYLENGTDFLTLEDGVTLFEQEAGP